MILRHYAQQPVVLDRTRQYSPKVHFAKPSGLWLSVGEAWKEWCTDEEFQTDRLAVVHEATLDPSANILHLASREDLLEFSRVTPTLPSWSRPYPDWEEVQQQYDGILIDPWLGYQPDIDLYWYNMWDVPSACIWNLSAVTSLVPLNSVVR